MIEVFLLGIAILWLIFASISDLKTHEVPDWLSYSLIIIGFVCSIFKSIIFNNIAFFFYSLFAFSLFFLISLLLYYTKQWGGGDVKLLIGLVTLFPVYPEELLNYFNPNLQIPFILILILNLILFGALYSLIYGVYLLIKNKINFLNELKKSKLNKFYILTPFLFLIISILIKDLVLKVMMLSFGLIILLTQFLLIYVRIIEDKCMFKKISINKLTEGDWITENIYSKKTLIYNKNSPGVTKNEIALIKKIKEYVTIKEGIPFIPTFLIAFIITIIFGNLIRI